MNLEHLSTTQKLIISGLMMALYIVVLYTTQSFSFGPYQIRIATSLYAVSYLCPFLIIPMGLASFFVGSPSLSQPSSFTRAWGRLCLEDIGGVAPVKM